MPTVASSYSVAPNIANRLLKVTGANATPVNHVTALADSIMRVVEIDARENPGEQVYLRIYAATSPTVGTTAAEILLPCPKGKKKTYYFPLGVIIPTGISLAVVKNAGGTSGADNPTGTVNLRILISDS